jgi:hypothetical protein
MLSFRSHSFLLPINYLIFPSLFLVSCDPLILLRLSFLLQLVFPRFGPLHPLFLLFPSPALDLVEFTDTIVGRSRSSSVNCLSSVWLSCACKLQTENRKSQSKSDFFPLFSLLGAMAMSSLTSSTSRTLGLCAGLGAAAFLGYCVYFDKSRR